MPIHLDRAAMTIALERAYQLARSEQPLSDTWAQRVARLALAPKTYIAAFGAALLAKATDDRVDSLSHKPEASERGYSLRGVAEFLASKQSSMGFDLGATGRWPLNNAPFNRNHARIDRFQSISSRARPYYDDLVRYLWELDQADEAEATEALAVFLRSRIAFAEAEFLHRRALVAQAASFALVLDAATLFVTEAPEGGRRGQAFVAAVLDCAFSDVRLRSINDPGRVDVSAWSESVMLLASEVKQLPVEISVAFDLAADAADAGCDRALLVALAPRQPMLDRERARHEGLATHGVLIEIVTSVSQLVSAVLLPAKVPLVAVAQTLQERFDGRMAEIGLSPESRERWNLLCRGDS